jgi:hypothetical protein
LLKKNKKSCNKVWQNLENQNIFGLEIVAWILQDDKSSISYIHSDSRLEFSKPLAEPNPILVLGRVAVSLPPPLSLSLSRYLQERCAKAELFTPDVCPVAAAASRALLLLLRLLACILGCCFGTSTGLLSFLHFVEDLKFV